MGEVEEECEEWEGVTSHVLAHEDREGWACTRFCPSPAMSSYLLCLVVGQYTATHRTAAHTRVSVHCPTNRPTEGVFAVETAIKCIHIFNEFFGLPYCLPKLDLVGVLPVILTLAPLLALAFALAPFLPVPIAADPRLAWPACLSEPWRTGASSHSERTPF